MTFILNDLFIPWPYTLVHDLWEVCSIPLCGKIRKGKGRGGERGKRRNQSVSLSTDNLSGRSTLGRSTYKSNRNGN